MVSEATLHHDPFASFGREPDRAVDVGPPDRVWLGASAPEMAGLGEQFTGRLVAYEEGFEDEVVEVLAKLSPSVRPRLALKRCQWRRGTRVTVRLSGTSLDVEPSEQDFVWQGEQELVDFDVTVSLDATPGVTVMRYDLSVGGVIVARLRLDLDIVTTPREVLGRRTARAVAARDAFASYASEDRQRVLDRVAAVRISAGLDVFLDCLSLHPGEQWKPRLSEEISGRDLFLLFWSANARESPWVTWEWQTALARKGIEGIQVHPLQTVAEAPPPEELKALHFGDVHMIVREADARPREWSAPSGRAGTPPSSPG